MTSSACLRLQPPSFPTRLRDDPTEPAGAATPSPAQEKFVAEAVDALVRVSQNAEPGTLKPSPEAFSNAIRFLTLLSVDVPIPDIGVDSDGDVAIDWDFGPRRVFSVRVDQGGRLYYAGLFGHATVHGSEDLRVWIPWEIQRGINRVLGQPPA